MNQLSIRKSIYSLENPVWLRKAGMSKGIDHDRQPLGIILPANADLQIRQLNESFKNSLSLRLLNNNQKTEKSLSIGHDWVTINNAVTSVPFIDTPYVDSLLNDQQAPIIEYRYPENSGVLPIYRKSDDETEFLKLCEEKNSEFFLIDSEYFLMLVPQCDRASINSLKNTIGLSGLVDEYERIMMFYNDLAGLSFTPKRSTDKNIANRYFIKADQHGAGGAYYGGDCVAETSCSLASIWLNDIKKEWGHLHEIAHGYEGYFMKNSSLDIEEVWNNIYAASYQDIYLGEKVFEYGWLYGNKNLFSVMKENLKNNTPVNSWNLEDKLYFMMLMKDKAGNDSFSKFNQSFRKFCNKEKVDVLKFNLLDRLADNYSKTGKIDVIPFIKLVGGEISSQQCSINQLYHKKAVYPLCELINQDKLSTIQSQLKLKTPFSLVDSLQLKSTRLTGNLKIKIDIDSFKEIYGEEFIMMEGQHPLLKSRITQKDFSLLNIPIGAYTLSLPTGKSNKYKINKQYAIIKEGDNQLNLNYFKKESSSIINQNIKFLGIGDEVFGDLTIDFPEKSMVINIKNCNPHSYFKDRKYFGINIICVDGTKLFNKEIQGLDLESKLGQDKINFDYGDIIELFHEEFRMFVDSGSFIAKEKNNLLRITPTGLQHVYSHNDSEIDLIKRIEEYSVIFKKNPYFIDCKQVTFKDDLYLAIQRLSEPNRTLLLEKYQDFLPQANQIDLHIGDIFTLDLLGSENHQVTQITIDRNQKTVTFAITENKNPHEWFLEETYAFVRYLDAMGVEKYQYNFIGKNTPIPEIKVFPLSQQGGERLFVYHKEGGNRFNVNNVMQNSITSREAKEAKVTYQLMPNGLQELATASPENLQLPNTVHSLTQALSYNTTTSRNFCSLGQLLTRASTATDSLLSTTSGSLFNSQQPC